MSPMVLILMSIGILKAQTCEPYVLYNECTGLVGPLVDIPEEFTSQQEYFDNALALSVSDLRMLPPSCRRPLVWFLCNIGFHTCGGAGELCTVNLTTVESLAAECGVAVENLARVSGTRRSRGTSLVCADVPVVVEDPIEVVTCLSDMKQPTGCCFGPFAKDPTSGECVTACFQYTFSPVKENAMFYTSGVLTCLNLVIFLIILPPIVVVFPVWHFPNYIPVLIYVVSTGLSITVNAAFFAGGAEAFVCRGNFEFSSALLLFLQSSRAYALAFFNSFFLLSNASWSVALAIVMLFNTVRYEYWYQARGWPQKFSPLAVIMFHVFCWGTPLVLSLASLSVALANPAESMDDVFYLTVGAGVYTCFWNPVELTYVISFIPYAMLTVFDTTLLLVILVLICSKDYRILVFQWRFIMYSVVFAIVSVNFVVYMFYFGSNREEHTSDLQREYTVCASLHPRNDVCEKGDSGLYPWIYISFAVMLQLFPFVSGLIFLSKGRVWRFWRDIFRCKLPQTIRKKSPPSELHPKNIGLQ